MTTEDRVEFACPNCGQRGQVVWKGGEDKNREVGNLSDGFHVEVGRLPGARHVVVCSTCDEIDPLRILASRPH